MKALLALIIIFTVVEGQANCYANPSRETLKSKQGEKVTGDIVAACQAEGEPVRMGIKELTNVQNLINAAEKDRKYLDEYFDTLTQLLNLQAQSNNLVSEISNFKGSYETETAQISLWSAQLGYISGATSKLIGTYEKATVLPEEHPLKKLLAAQRAAEFDETFEIIEEYLKRYPEGLLKAKTADWTPIKKLEKDVADAKAAFALARQRLDKRSADFYNGLTQIHGPEVSAVRIQSIYSKFRDESQLSELVRSYRLLLAQGIYLTVKDDIEGQKIRLKAVIERLGKNAQYVDTEIQRDLNLLMKAETVSAASTAEKSYKLLQSALKAQKSSLQKSKLTASSIVSQKIESWLKESNEKGYATILQLKGEILYREAQAALKVSKVAK
ncbi:hypothetical protein AZI87_04485 [Bdellovibrio bacteriovorus]|uniref:Uncharacterized protein n=1 Tax=Bdellovibrio bacteriovorus TaxID=959 RepID=A0A161PT83_BDEBC|nr:hypothetical protein [Bdellovibrio bacteriovorus]KYG68508.1 hypothetical protein AZI87_04485 [Bdellovibrio bacteriovorus]